MYKGIFILTRARGWPAFMQPLITHTLSNLSILTIVPLLWRSMGKVRLITHAARHILPLNMVSKITREVA